MAGAPVTLNDAQAHGLGPWRLRTKAWRRIGPGIYLPAALADTRELRIEAASRRLPPGAAFSGLTAAWLHGLDVDPCNPIEVTVPTPTTISTRSGMVVRRRAMEASDVVKARGYRATSMVRVLSDLYPRLTLTEAVVLADMALNRHLVTIADLRRAQLPDKLLGHVEPASESAMETRLRMLLVNSRLPRPAAQVTIRDRWDRIIGRPDLYYADRKLGLEYDGITHRTTLPEDNRRQNRLLRAGVTLLRFTAGDLRDTPAEVVAAVRAALAA